MPKIIDYYFSPISPWAYLGGPRLIEIAARHGAEVRVKPVALKTVFPQTGGLPLAKRAPARQAYRLMELRRWRDHLGLPITLHPAHFPAPDEAAAGLIIAAGETGGDPLRLSQAVLAAVWAEERDIADPATLEAIAGETGHDGPALLAKAEDPAIQATYQALSEEAVARGVFGSPTYALGDELFWGQDRLDFLDRALER
jgi:2-hydroxychromene-2-carboxylate isomerase